MLLADRDQIWPRLEELGEKQVRIMLAAGEIPSHEEEEVQEWLRRTDALTAASDTTITKWIAVVGAIAAIVAAVASVIGLIKVG